MKTPRPAPWFAPRTLTLLAAALAVGAVAVSPPSAAMPAGGRRSEAQLRPLAEDRGATGLGLALRKIGSGVSVLTIVAHPDDENNALHALLSRGLGARVSLVSLTRGGGGQNEIGPELFDGLRILRTEELLTSHRLDSVEQYFGMVSDFGYSFSVEETLEKWNEEKTLGEVVRLLRMFRPDVVFTLPPTGTGGGQHHQATGRLVHEAFDVADDPDRFPEHADLGLLPWRPVRLLIGGVGGSPVSGETRTVRVDTAVWDPLLGRTYADLGAEARSAHRCQGMGQVLGGPSGFPAELVETRGAEDGTALGPEGTDGLFAGIPTGLERLEAFVAGTPEAAAVTRERLDSLREAVEEATNAFSAIAPQDSLPGLRRALAAANGLRRDTLPEGLTAESRAEIEHRMAPRAAQIQEAIGLAHGLVVDAVADTGTAVPGGRFAAQVFVRGGPVESATVTGIHIEVPEGWEVDASPATTGIPSRPGPRRRAPAPAIGPGDLPLETSSSRPLRAEFGVSVAENAALSRQPWLDDPDADRFDPLSEELFALSARPPQVTARVVFESAGVPVEITTPVEYRYEGPWVGTEKQKEISVLPVASVALSPEIVVFPRGQNPRRLGVSVVYRGDGAAEFNAVLEAPAGWAVAPESIPVAFSGPGETRVEFEVSAPAGAADGGYRLAASAQPVAGGEPFTETVQEIAYHHIETRYLFRPAEAAARVLDATVAPVHVGYVEGVGDEVAEAIAQLGVPLTFLDEAALAEGDLSGFDTIVLGVRAYLARPDLRTHNQRLLDYVAGGGTLLVQYNKFEFNAGPWGPYPISVGRGRITDENAPMQVLIPDHPAFTGPNRIDDADWAGWVQERGLYFLAPGGDPAYQDLLASEDPFEYNAGEKRGILVEARHGEGRWLYLGLGLWRQLPAGTPGAYRLLANLLSLGYQPETTDQQ
ncbi:MAG: PIG-L family deacetylase [Acidobacteria bacterium]|nr:PIG-L family deacetylase [Acidobacteriota bacterium]MYG74300.1 PIG-L family deacetylase [Acidobacteriota bacterium]